MTHTIHSTMSNWLNELEGWCPSLNALAYYGPKSERRMLLPKDTSDLTYNVVITTYEYVCGVRCAGRGAQLLCCSLAD